MYIKKFGDDLSASKVNVASVTCINAHKILHKPLTLPNWFQQQQQKILYLITTES